MLEGRIPRSKLIVSIDLRRRNVGFPLPSLEVAMDFLFDGLEKRPVRAVLFIPGHEKGRESSTHIGLIHQDAPAAPADYVSARQNGMNVTALRPVEQERPGVQGRMGVRMFVDPASIHQDDVRRLPLFQTAAVLTQGDAVSLPDAAAKPIPGGKGLTADGTGVPSRRVAITEHLVA